jgi:hypothetical protein
VNQATAIAIKAALLSDNVNVTLSAGPQVNRDGALDNLIVAHEFGHYVSGRLIGNGTGSRPSNRAAWARAGATCRRCSSRWRDGDNYAGTYGMSGYASSTSITPSNSYYFGGRRYPYSNRPGEESADVQAHLRRELPAGRAPAESERRPELRGARHRRGVVHDAVGVLRRAAPGRRQADVRPGTQQRMRDYLVAAAR